MAAGDSSRRALGMAALLFAPGICLASAQEAVMQEVDAGSIADPAPAEAGTPEIAAGTLIEIRIDEPVDSKTHKTGDWYAISLARPVLFGDRTVVPAGTPGRGQVVHAAKSSWGGKAGELVLGARYLEFEGSRIALRGMKLGALGGSNEGLAFASSLVLTPLPFMINGKNAEIQAGTLATAKLAEAMRIAPPEAGVDSAATKILPPVPDAVPAEDNRPIPDMGETGT